MRPPNTADERERRFVEYIKKLNKGQLAEIKLVRLNRIANFRKTLMGVINAMVEARAEDLAAGMLMEKADKRPALVLNDKPVPFTERKRKTPPWVKEEANALRKKGELKA